MQNDCVAELCKVIPNEQIDFDVPMKKYTSFKVGGLADILIKVKSSDEVEKILSIAKKYKMPIHIIGNGTNILVADSGIRGIVIKNELDNVKIENKQNDVEVTLGSGVKLARIAQIFQQKGIEGFEFASGIPGTIGGAVKMNAGAHGKEMKDIVVSSKVMDADGNVKILNNEENQFEYRSSIFNKEKYFILEATLKLQKGDSNEIKNRMDEYMLWRKEHQPLEYSSAGSTFKRGKDYITAKLIDDCGLKGYSIGDAQVSTKHTGFIVNKGNATAKDVLDLIEYVKKEVYNKFNKEIEMELEVFK